MAKWATIVVTTTLAFSCLACPASCSDSDGLDIGQGQCLDEVDEVSLLQTSTLKKRSHIKVDSQAHAPNAPGWFGDFFQGESSYTSEGALAGRNDNPTLDVLDGWEPVHDGPCDHEKVKDATWFQSSNPGGRKMALQPYPPIESSVGGEHEKVGDWFSGTGGELQQSYVEAATLASSEHSEIPASWFDSSVYNMDGFGRPKYPGLGSPLNYLEWQERSVNTSLTCKIPGCIANVSLHAPFDPEKEMYKNCKISVFFHPTDFDDEYSGERVDWVQVNGKEISSNCRPIHQGCDQTAQRPLIPCVSELPIDTLIQSGDLNIAAQIPKVVDECPYNGNLLSAVPVVTCLVTAKPVPQEAPKPVWADFEKPEKGECITSMPLQCATRGCASEIAIPISHECRQLGNCRLSIKVAQTDFDGHEGTLEVIEYIKVDKQQVVSWPESWQGEAWPGRNPCKEKEEGSTNSSNVSHPFLALKDHAVNVNTKSGIVLVEGKISESVDECASNGYLFDALAVISCGDATDFQAENWTSSWGKTKNWTNWTNYRTASMYSDWSIDRSSGRSSGRSSQRADASASNSSSSSSSNLSIRADPASKNHDLHLSGT